MGEYSYKSASAPSAGKAARIHQEGPFERYISRKVASLAGSGWEISPDDSGFDAADALVFDDFVEFLERTAPEKLDKMRREKGQRWRAHLRRALVRRLESMGTILTLRRGLPMAGYQTIECMAGYPDDERIPGARECYDANILRFMHQVHYQTAGRKSLDFALFINGIPVATGEVKTELTQTVRDAINEYAEQRKPVEPDGGRKNPLLMYKRGAPSCTSPCPRTRCGCARTSGRSRASRPSLASCRSTWAATAARATPTLPRASTRPTTCGTRSCRGTTGCPSSTGFVFEEVERQTGRERADTATGRHADLPPLPSVRRRAQADSGCPRARAPVSRYLIEHSAGSGKTETISWTAHDLARLRRADGEQDVLERHRGHRQAVAGPEHQEDHLPAFEKRRDRSL